MGCASLHVHPACRGLSPSGVVYIGLYIRLGREIRARRLGMIMARDWTAWPKGKVMISILFKPASLFRSPHPPFNSFGLRPVSDTGLRAHQKPALAACRKEGLVR